MSIRYGVLAPTMSIMDIVGAEQRDGLRCGGIWRMEEEASSKSSSRSTSRSVSEHSNDDLPVPQVMEELLEKFENIPQERTSKRTQTVDMPVPETRTFLQERISERTQITVPVPFQEETDEVIKLFPALYPAERTSQRAAEQIVDSACTSDPGANCGSRKDHSAGSLRRSVPSYKLRMCQCPRS